MGRVWITAAPNGKVQVLLGRAAVREKRRLGRQIDATIARASRGALVDGDIAEVERLAAMADRLARSG
jgi:hypothetical protein